MTKNKKLLIIFVIFLVMFLCMRCARADYFADMDSSVSTVSVSPSPSPSPVPSKDPDYSVITSRMDDLYDLIYNSRFQILISIWAFTGLALGYVIIKDSFR